MASLIVAGIVAGLVATLIMTVLMMAMSDDPMPTALFASRFLNDEPPERNQGLGMGLHFVYGTLAALVFAWLADAYLLAGAPASWDLGTAAGYGAGWGVVLWIGFLGWATVIGLMDQMRELDSEERMKRMGGVLFVHLVYGAVLGAVLPIVGAM